MISDWIAIQIYINARGRGRVSRELENVIAMNGETAFLYALQVINGRFRKGEKSIARRPDIALKYAKFVLADRFREGEKGISSNPELCYEYFKHVVQDKLPKSMHQSMIMMSFKFPGNLFIAKYLKEIGVMS